MTALIASCLYLSSCSFVGDESNQTQRVIGVPAQNVEVLDTSPESVAFEFTGGLPSPCYAFDEAVVEQRTDTSHVKVYARSTAEICIAIIGTLQVSPLTLEAPGPGAYTFAFWRGDDQEPLLVDFELP